MWFFEAGRWLELTLLDEVPLDLPLDSLISENLLFPKAPIDRSFMPIDLPDS